MKIIFLLCSFCAFIANAKGLSLDMRIQIIDSNIFRCISANNTLQTIAFNPNLFVNDNKLGYISLSDIERIRWGLGISVDLFEPLSQLKLLPAHSVTNYVEATDELNLETCFGGYGSFTWNLINANVPVTVVTGLLSNEFPLQSPVVSKKSTNIEAILAYVYNKDASATPELGFLVLNGTNVSVTVMQPLFNDSRLIVTAPSINYSNEVFTVCNTATNAVVEPRAVAEWRIPWQSTYQQLPAPDRTQLEAAGNVDLYWKCGNYVSPVLPVFLKP